LSRLLRNSQEKGGDTAVERKRVLIVDDDRHVLLLCQRELTEEGYDVLTASGCAQALELLEQEKPDLVILDIRMPGADGLDAIGRILSIDKKLPVVFYSAYCSYRDNFLAWSADAFVEKSQDLGNLKKVVGDLLARGSGRSRVTPWELSP